jgi:hypothetical protein
MYLNFFDVTKHIMMTMHVLKSDVADVAYLETNS